MRPLGWASLVANIGIVVTGGAVRLTGSGLGCPTWPRCTETSFTPHGELDLHSAIEFGNRMLTFVLVAVAVATFVAAWATGAAGPAPARAGARARDPRPGGDRRHHGAHRPQPVGGLVPPAAVDGDDRRGGALPAPDRPARPCRPARGPVVALAWATFAATWVVLYLGTVVTGSGPHAGDVDSPRNGLDPLQLSQLHADAVFLLVGLTVGLLVAVHGARRPARGPSSGAGLLGVELAQGAIGFVQYATDLPEVLVGFHMLGAALISAAVTWALPAPSAPTARRPRQAV